MSQPKAKLRMAPTPAILSSQQTAVEQLLKLDAWTEEPANPPSGALKQGEAPLTSAVQEKAPVAPPVPPKRPWQTPSPDAVHPYHVVLSEQLFQKLDFAWKRNGYKSMRELVLLTLVAEADKILKELGETP